MKLSRLLLTFLAIVSFGALAQQAPQDPTAAPAGARAKATERLKAADTNGDGKISRDEAAALPGLAKHFDQIDTNKDGFITRDELKAAHGKMQKAHLAKADTDGDGKISREEAAKFPRLAKNFDAIDTNKDGYLSKEEIKAAHQARAAK